MAAADRVVEQYSSDHMFDGSIFYNSSLQAGVFLSKMLKHKLLPLSHRCVSTLING